MNSGSLIRYMEQDQFVGSPDRDRMLMFRGKSSKRRRLSSPSSSGREEGFSSTWAVTSSGEVEDSTEEEEDMANCLILLSQGDSFKKRVNTGPRLYQMAGAAIAEASFCAYECKTCNRAFPSFQALGGHRASHKKPKLIPTSIAAIGEKVKKLSSLTDPDETEETTFNEKTNPNKGKFHECSICGLEFSSGQALGGHMRRHRAQAAMIVDEADHIQERHTLPLDLNLPLPEDDHRDTILQFPATQKSLVFPSPALVHCYY